MANVVCGLWRWFGVAPEQIRHYAVISSVVEKSIFSVKRRFLRSARKLARERPKAIFILTVVAEHNTTRRERPKTIFILAVVAVHNTIRAVEMTPRFARLWLLSPLRASYLARVRPKAIFILTVVAVLNTTRRERPKTIFILTIVAVHNTIRRERPKTNIIR